MSHQMKSRLCPPGLAGASVEAEHPCPNPSKTIIFALSSQVDVDVFGFFFFALFVATVKSNDDIPG